MKKKYLIISPTGGQSLHNSWLEINFDKEIIFDLWCVNYSDIINFGTIDISDENTPKKFTKIELLNYIIKNKLEDLQEYEFIWFPDDDIKINGDQLNKFFKVCSENKFSLAQPALEWNSYSSFPVTMSHLGANYRRTTFVEIMAPCFSIAALNLLANKQLFNSRAGWGIESYWMENLNPLINTFAIVDSTPMLHTRPLGGPNYAWLEGGSAIEEMHQELENHKYINKRNGWFRCNLEFVGEDGKIIKYIDEKLIYTIINACSKGYRNSSLKLSGYSKINMKNKYPNLELDEFCGMFGHANFGEYIQMQINVSEFVDYFKNK